MNLKIISRLQNFKERIVELLIRQNSTDGLMKWTGWQKQTENLLAIGKRKITYLRNLRNTTIEVIFVKDVTFTPIFRAHGTNVPREIWQFGEEGTLSYDNQVKYIYLRYRLLPYIYSMSHQVTAKNYTMLRGLAMDFTTDTRTFDIDNAYMFGTSLLVRPVFHPQSEEKNICIYLPET